MSNFYKNYYKFIQILYVFINFTDHKSYEEKFLIDKIPIYIFKFDFNNDDKIYSMFCYLDPLFRKANKKVIADEFKKNCLICNGFVKNLENAILFCLNEPCNKQTIAHELCHYFQEIIHVIENNDVLQIDSGIQSLQLTKKQLEYLLNSKEFYPHIFIEMIKDFKKIYFILYKNLSINEFLNSLFDNVEKHKEKIMFSDFGFNYLKNMEDTTSLQMLSALKYLNYHYTEVKEKITNELMKDKQK